MTKTPVSSVNSLQGLDIYTDELTRRLYATDASIYEELPAGVSFPKNIHDIQALVIRSIQEGFPITARSAGTSLAGQTTGEGVIMDVSRYMTAIRHIDPQNRMAELEPGVIRDTLNRAATKHNLQFGPDTATTNRCMIGGMIGNNSCGSFSIKHGTTREHTIRIDTVLSDGSIVSFQPLNQKELDDKCSQNDLEGSIYREMLKLLQTHKTQIIDNYPHPEIKRRNTGYALDRLCEMDPITPGGRPFNLAELLCGSEGTLALTASATLNLVPLPAAKTLLIPQFHSLHEAMLATVEAVKWEPAAVELVDDIILNATKGNIEQRKNRFFLDGDPGCILIIQFEGDDPEKFKLKASGLAQKLKDLNLGYAHPVLTEPDLMSRVWELRKAGLGLLMGLGQESRSPTFVEDTAVRVADLPAYVKEFQQIMDTYNTSCVFYAHASVGELHLRPMMDLTKPEGLQMMKSMANDVAKLVKKYRGSLSGEHGDGRARAPFIETVLGKEMMPILQQVKEIWDPEYRFNPGKIIKPKPMESNLRFSPEYVGPNVDTTFQWRNEGGFAAAIELCNGAGVCRKLAQSGGTMCPSYHATRDEKDSTRGRANLFRQLFSGKQKEAFRSDELREALDLCLSCKACKSECPANVDMAKMKAEFTHGWHQANGVTLSDYFFGHPEKFYPAASLFAGLTNFINRQKPVKKLLESVLKIHPDRDLPKFASQTFEKWYKKNRKLVDLPDGKDVVLLVDLFTNYHEPEVAIAACKVLRNFGYNVIIPGIFPTGRPQLSKGFLDDAVNICTGNIKRLKPYADQGMPIVGLEPSEILTLRDEYPDLCSESDLTDARRIADHTFLWEEFLCTVLAGSDDKSNGQNGTVYIHGHCHTKSLVGNDPMIQAFKGMGFEPVALQTGCCGMAGSFGYQKDKYDLSMDIGNEVLFPALKEIADEPWICAPGFSCRHQINDG
ncbi:MAG: FAD-linked oxidase C-terminal domain-containing protein, partial [Balneolaceae bacterium]